MSVCVCVCVCVCACVRLCVYVCLCDAVVVVVVICFTPDQCAATFESVDNSLNRYTGFGNRVYARFTFAIQT